MKQENEIASKMRPIKGYFKVERKTPEGEILDVYEDHNTIMVRVPALFAALTAGMMQAPVKDFHINSFTLGTNGTYTDAYGNEIPKTVTNDRTQIFSEEDFWNDFYIRKGQQPGAPKPPPPPADCKPPTPPKPNPPRLTSEMDQIVVQRTWDIVPYGDQGKDTSVPKLRGGGNQGMTYPIDNGITLDKPIKCGTKMYSKIPKKVSNTKTEYRKTVDVNKPENNINVQTGNEGNTVTFIIDLGQYAGNLASDEYIPYTEAGLYMKYLENDRDVLCSGDTLGQLFAMKTFPPQYKNSSCVIQVTWKLYF